MQAFRHLLVGLCAASLLGFTQGPQVPEVDTGIPTIEPETALPVSVTSGTSASTCKKVWEPDKASFAWHQLVRRQENVGTLGNATIAYDPKHMGHTAMTHAVTASQGFAEGATSARFSARVGKHHRWRHNNPADQWHLRFELWWHSKGHVLSRAGGGWADLTDGSSTATASTRLRAGSIIGRGANLRSEEYRVDTSITRDGIIPDDQSEPFNERGMAAWEVTMRWDVHYHFLRPGRL